MHNVYVSIYAHVYIDRRYSPRFWDRVNLVWKHDGSLWFEVERSEGAGQNLASVGFSDQLLVLQDSSGLTELREWSLISVCK